MRTRAISVGQLRTLEALARHLNFRAAAQELALTQSAVSRQLQALEEEVGVPLFVRHTRSVELTSAGTKLLQAVTPSLERIDHAVRTIRQSVARQSISISTWASFASMWLIPKMQAFQNDYPDIDFRIDTTDALIDLDNSDADLALRYTRHPQAESATRLFGEQLTPVASPWLIKSSPPIEQAQDLAAFTLVDVADSAYRGLVEEWLSWQRWFTAHHIPQLQPKRWLYFHYAHQIGQAALAGQGVAMGRTSLMIDSLLSGDLVEVLPAMRLNSPMAYWLLVNQHSTQRPEIQAFCTWLKLQAQLTRVATGEEASHAR